MFAIQRDDGKIYCVPGTVKGGWRYMKDVVNPWMHYYPSVINCKRNKLRKLYSPRRKIKTIELTANQIDLILMAKLRN